MITVQTWHTYSMGGDIVFCRERHDYLLTRIINFIIVVASSLPLVFDTKHLVPNRKGGLTNLVWCMEKFDMHEIGLLSTVRLSPIDDERISAKKSRISCTP